MKTCEVCDCTLDSEVASEPMRFGESAYYVCCYTCETVMQETVVSHGPSVRSTIT